jgi:hypothetical protein
MPGRRHKRLERVEKSFAARPLRSDLVKAAYEHFRETGELPEHDRLASEVLRHARWGYTPDQSTEARILKILERARARRDQGLPTPEEPSVRECLFHEAMHEHDIVRQAARVALRWEVDCGADVTDPEFLADRGLPEFGTVGLHLLGYPDRLLRPPYEEQGRRMLTRYAELRARVREEDEVWFERLSDTIVASQDRGDVPGDDLLRDAVLVFLELDSLIHHARGRDVSERMAALDTAATTEGPEREEAIERVRALMARSLA